MKSFLKYTLASILGIIIGLLLFTFIMIGIFSSASAEKPVMVEPNSLLIAKFDTPIVDRNPDSPFESFDFLSLSPDNRIGLDAILKNLKKAATDDNIKGIFINAPMVPAGIGTIEEIRDALLAFKESGKFIIAHADMYTLSGYYLSSVADKVYLTPEGAVEWLGISSEVLFFKKALEKLGIDVQVIKQGEYKGAPEMFMYEKLSDENRAQISAYINSLWDGIVTNVAASRGLSEDSLNFLADNISISSAEAAQQHGLITDLKYFDEVLDELKSLTDTPTEKDLKSVSMKRYIKAPEIRLEKGLSRNKIAVVYASGSIITGDNEGELISSDRFARAIRKARRDSTIKAIVIRVNSGGGSALASEVIWREVKLASEVKPVIASMGDVAASGGYYILAAADKIIANPNTITGSIGVFGIIPNAKELMNDKLGITSDVVKTNDHADFMSIFRPLNSEETKVLQFEIANIYKTFVKRVADGRGMSVEEVDKLARGQIYSGEDAMKLGLIDEFGGLERAIEIAAAEAGVEAYRITKFPEITDPFEALMKQFTGEVKIKILRNELGENFTFYKQLKMIEQMTGIQALMPFEIIVK
jgi:protease IV